MPKYNIYAGIGGGFGGANLVATEEFDTEDEALEYAYEQAAEEYWNNVGLHGLYSIDDYLRENPDWDADMAEEAVNEDMESWIDYWVELI